MFNWLRRRPDKAAATAEPPNEEFTWLRGRRHLSAVPYLLPQDLEEANRNDFQHFLFRQVLHGNFVAPLRSPLAILDVGSGTGRWAMEMAAYYPQANVVGLDVAVPSSEDLSGPGGGLAARPLNYVFVQGDVLQGVPFAAQTFDFVHMRMLFLAIPGARWPSVVAELARVTRRGGWVELLEAYRLQNGGPAGEQLVTWLGELGMRRGIAPEATRNLRDYLRMAGLRDINAGSFTIPVGRYGGRIGALMFADLRAALRGIGPSVTRLGLASQAQFDHTLAALEHDVETYRAFMPFFLAYGRRP